MERMIGVEEARGRLGPLADAIANGAEPIVLSRRGRALAVLVGLEEYARLKEAAAILAREQLRERLSLTRERIAAAGLEPGDVDEAIRMVREMG